MRRTSTFSSYLSLVATALTFVASNEAATAADKPLVKTTHVYKTVGDVKVQADVSRPEGAEVFPVVVWIQGGALIVGSAAADSQVSQQILELCTRERFVFVSRSIEERFLGRERQPHTGRTGAPVADVNVARFA